jgi:pimeloyl-ACP methyl ester carboxylesterase
MELHTRVMGTGPRIVLVHGSLTTSEQSWERQEPLAERWTLVIPDRRGYAPNPDADHSDFKDDATDIAPMLDGGAHLVGHSYGATVALCLAGMAPDAVRSLTLIETPPTGLVRYEPAFELMIAAGNERRATISDPEQYLRAHLVVLGAPLDKVPSPLPAAMERQVRLLMNERPPWELEPAESLDAAPFPKLVVSGGHSDELERSSDAVAEHLGPNVQRVVMTGRGHVVQRLGEPFNELLEKSCSRPKARDRPVRSCDRWSVARPWR